MQPLAFPDEERNTELLFQLTNPGRDIRLHPMKPFGRPGDAARANDGIKNAKVGEIHASLPENDMILFIHLTRSSTFDKTCSCTNVPERCRYESAASLFRRGNSHRLDGDDQTTDSSLSGTSQQAARASV